MSVMSSIHNLYYFLKIKMHGLKTNVLAPRGYILKLKSLKITQNERIFRTRITTKLQGSSSEIVTASSICSFAI